MKLIGKVNSDIADWLSVSRTLSFDKKYPAYTGTRSDGVSKSSTFRVSESSPVDGNTMGLPVLGMAASIDLQELLVNVYDSVFQTPWQNIVSSMESMAESHALLAQKIEADVERPLRDYQSKNREMQGMSTIQGNLAAMAKELEEAQKKSEKLQAKGGRADTKKVSSAVSGVQDSSQQWESQAPYVFEQLQALDESRVNHLRDCLTQLQTHEVDQLERSRITAESTLNALLNVSTADEISAFVARLSGGLPTMRPRRQSRPGSSQAPSSPAPPTPAIPLSVPRTLVQSSEAPSTSLAPPTPVPPRSMDDGQSERSVVSGSAMKPPASGMIWAD